MLWAKPVTKFIRYVGGMCVKYGGGAEERGESSMDLGERFKKKKRKKYCWYLPFFSFLPCLHPFCYCHLRQAYHKITEEREPELAGKHHSLSPLQSLAARKKVGGGLEQEGKPVCVAFPLPAMNILPLNMIS